MSDDNEWYFDALDNNMGQRTENDLSHRWDLLRYSTMERPMGMRGAVTCKYCKKTGLEWMAIRDGAWRTAERIGSRLKIHTCRQSQMQMSQMPWEATKPEEPTKPTEESSNMNYSLIHAHTPDYVALEVVFPNGSKPYIYKANLADNFQVNDKAVVIVDNEYKIVTVIGVHTNPVAKLDMGKLYSWVVQKIDMTNFAIRTKKQSEMVEQLNVWEAQRRTMELVESQKKLVESLPNGMAELEHFKQLGVL